MKKTIRALFAASTVSLVFFAGNNAGLAATDAGSGDNAAERLAGNPLATLRAGHPRLVFSQSDWARFDAKQKRGDARFNALMARLKKDADAFLNEPPATYKKVGHRMLGVSRDSLRRILTLAVVYRATHEDAYLRRAEKEMLAASDFPNWNPAHFLDTAEMTTALALGYDWLYADLTPAAREKIKVAIIEKALHDCTDPKKNWWHRQRNNWIQVCWGGMTLGALAVAESEPALAREVLDAARAGIAHGLKPYAPEGVYPEGPAYWGYGTSYQVLMISALETALGTDWGLTQSPGFLPSAAAQLQLTGATGKVFNFADGGESVVFDPALHWFAKRLANPALYVAPAANDEHRFLPLLALWFPEKETAGKTAPPAPLAWKGEGITPVAVFRSEWSNPNALYFACKAGSASSSHGHMDAGAFILENDGVRWAVDLGAQDYYSIESKGISLWDARQTGDRWKVFRCSNFSHNTLTIGGKLHRVTGRTEFTNFENGEKTGGVFGAEIDLSPVFAGDAKKVIRNFKINPKTRSVTITDSVAGATAGTEVRWAMVTRAAVELHGNEAILKQKGKTLRARVSEKQLQFEVIPCDPPADNFNAPNPNTRFLIIRAKAPASGDVNIAVELTPR